MHIFGHVLGGAPIVQMSTTFDDGTVSERIFAEIAVIGGGGLRTA